MDADIFRKRILALGGQFRTPRSRGRGRQAILTETITFPRQKPCHRASEDCNRPHVIRVRTARVPPTSRRRCEVCGARWR
jgi:hypothetical protein